MSVMLDEGKVLQDVIQHGLPCELKLRSYNDAISLQARLIKYVRKLNDVYSQGNNPYEVIEIILIKPKTLLFEHSDKVGLTVKSVSPASQGDLLP